MNVKSTLIENKCFIIIIIIFVCFLLRLHISISCFSLFSESYYTVCKQCILVNSFLDIFVCMAFTRKYIRYKKLCTTPEDLISGYSKYILSNKVVLGTILQFNVHIIKMRYSDVYIKNKNKFMYI